MYRPRMGPEGSPRKDSSASPWNTMRRRRGAAGATENHCLSMLDRQCKLLETPVAGLGALTGHKQKLPGAGNLGQQSGTMCHK